MKSLILAVAVALSCAVGLATHRVHTSHAWKVHQITGVSMLQIVTGY